jgi:uncharacterized protein
MNLFKKAKAVEGNIDLYLASIERAALTFELGIKDYFNDKSDQFMERYAEISDLESKCDNLRRDIKITLYTDLLIPDARGDVLGLIETLDNVVDVAEKVIMQFSIERPVVWDFLVDDFIALTEAVVKSVQDLISASRAFFREFPMVTDYINKVHYWEHEADKIEERIKRKAFDSDAIEQFSKKVHMRYFAEKISLLADESESVAERLEVYAVKRSI